MTYQIIDGIPVFGEVELSVINQMKTCMEPDAAIRGAVNADGHKGYSMPIGGVIAYRGMVSPSGAGYDIGCGSSAVLLNLDIVDIKPNIARIMDDIFSVLSFGVGRKNNETVDDPVFDSPAWGASPVSRELKELAVGQFGSIGSGNHHVNIMVDDGNKVWVVCHFGSRGFGHKVATHFIKAGGGRDGIDVPPVLLPDSSDIGQEYLHCMLLAGEYASRARAWVVRKVASLLGAEILDEVNRHHNFVFRERHDGDDLWVVRKGATPAFPGMRSFIGGSMGDNSVIVEGIDSDESRLALYSAPHGAGRVMSRTQAAGKRGKRGAPRKGGLISREMMMEWLRPLGVELRGAGVDESPHVYRRIDDVLRHHSNTLRVIHVLRPIGVAMAGADLPFDPYAD